MLFIFSRRTVRHLFRARVSFAGAVIGFVYGSAVAAEAQGQTAADVQMSETDGGFQLRDDLQCERWSKGKCSLCYQREVCNVYNIMIFL